MHSPVELTGFTTNGQPTYRGIWKLQDTYGLPLSITLMLLYERGQWPDWAELVSDMRKSGLKSKRIASMLVGAIDDAMYPQNVRSDILDRLRMMGVV